MQKHLNILILQNFSNNIPSHRWDSITPAEVVDDWHLKQNEPQPITALAPTDGPKLPITCLFKTREGTLGVLQLVGVDDAKTAKIRYKLVQGTKAEGASLHFGPDPADRTFLNGVASRNGGVMEAWLTTRPDGKMLQLHIGDRLIRDGDRIRRNYAPEGPGPTTEIGRVTQIDDTGLVLERDGERWRLTIGETLAKACARPATAASLYLGPVIEETLKLPFGRSGIMLDLETGRRFVLPDLDEYDNQQTRHFIRQSGTDVTAGVDDGVPGVAFAGAAGARIPSARWESITPAEIVDSRLLSEYEQDVTSILTVLDLKSPDLSELPLTCLFQTREGSFGVLQLVGANDEVEGGAKILYRMVQPIAPTGDWFCTEHPELRQHVSGKCCLCRKDVIRRPE